MASLAEIRAKLLEKENKFGNSQGGGSSNEIYAFWNIPEGSTATLRFLPDGDDKNTFFWAERLIIRLPFAGIIGQPDAKNVVVQVPCMDMWDRPCPILSEVRPWFKDPELEALGRKYWKKRSYIFQGFVINDPMNEKEVPENPIRRFVINSGVFNIIKSSLMDPEMEEMPTDYQAGRDFKLAKTKKGQYADYSTSSWSMRARALSDEELAAIEEFGLFNLKDYLPKEPSDKEIGIIKEMFEASVNGENYDPDKWGNYFKPAGFQNAENRSSIPTPEATTDVVKENPPFEVRTLKEEEAPASKAQSALNALKQRISEPEEVEDDEVPLPKVKSSGDAEKPNPSQILDMIKKRRTTA